MTIESSEFDVTEFDKNLLLTTSFIYFIFVGAVEIYWEHYWTGLSSLLSGVTSAIYWSNHTCPKRHFVDLCVTRASVVVYLVSVFNPLLNMPIIYAVTVMLLFSGTTISYLCSQYFWDNEKREWIIFHFLFHTFLFISSVYGFFILEYEKTLRY